uniref:Uncharacterized protein n=1 Tax=Octopus bimaculoides TaxID=37653 RepID=A0A0L8HL92_OCTBM
MPCASNQFFQHKCTTWMVLFEKRERMHGYEKTREGREEGEGKSWEEKKWNEKAKG